MKNVLALQKVSQGKGILGGFFSKGSGHSGGGWSCGSNLSLLLC